VNYPYLHLLVNHVPLLGAFFALALLIWGLLRKSRELTRVALIITVFVAAMGYAAYFTGDEAHEQLEDLPGYDHDRVHEHEEAGEWAWYALAVTGVLAAGTLVLGRGTRTPPKFMVPLVAVALSVTAGIAVRTAMLGGVIQHEEIRGSLFAPPEAPVLPSALPPDSAASLGHPDSTKADSGKLHKHENGTEHEH
jgi:hypothetical protein